MCVVDTAIMIASCPEQAYVTQSKDIREMYPSIAPVRWQSELESGSGDQSKSVQDDWDLKTT
jgi:hypothetical protein